MIHSIVLAVQSTVPDATPEGGNLFVIMSICMILGIIIAKIGIQNKGKGSSLPLLQPLLGRGFGWPELIAGFCIGHLLGVGTVLGLTNLGVIS
ncbi:MAG: photosystem I reaction center subunit PsaK [Coleofasciculus sp. S288]|nr:photosystem I reaction center subunit PsaK [Coleofasciculus sp. S288]